MSLRKKILLPMFAFFAAILCLILPTAVAAEAGEEATEFGEIAIHEVIVPYTLTEFTSTGCTIHIALDDTSATRIFEGADGDSGVLIDVRTLQDYRISTVRLDFEGTPSLDNIRDITVVIPFGCEITIPHQVLKELLNAHDHLEWVLRGTWGNFSVQVASAGQPLSFYNYVAPLRIKQPLNPDGEYDLQYDALLMMETGTMDFQARSCNVMIGERPYLVGKVYHDGYYQIMTTTSPAFTDLEDWMCTAVYRMYHRGIAQGVSAESYQPNVIMTREQSACLLMRYLDVAPVLIPPQPPKFADDEQLSAYARDGVYAAAALGVMQGIGDNFFAPQETISRQDMAVMVHRMMAVMEILPPNIEVEAPTFSDWDQVESYAERAMAELVSLGLLRGADGYLRPLYPVTRAEAAQILSNVLDFDVVF